MKNNQLPLEDQLCTLEQSKELAELLGDDAPGSLWGWATRGYGDTKQPYFLVFGPYIEDTQSEYYPAYTGDELGALLTSVHDYFLAIYCDAGVNHECEARMYSHDEGKRFSCFKRNKREARAKADLVIQGLREGWIKKEDFNYESK